MQTGFHEVWIAADEAKIYEALTTRHGLDGWWGPVLEATAEVGATVSFDHGLSDPLNMEVIELAEASRVVWRFTSQFEGSNNPASEWHGQIFEFDITPREVHDLLGMAQDVSVLKLTNSRWADEAKWFAFCSTAWAVTLETKLKPWCESNVTSTGEVGKN